MGAFYRVLDFAKYLVQNVVEPGDVAVDATAGNGNDTLFLAELVGRRGSVYAFDVQEEAINRTREKLLENRLLDRVKLVCDGHQNLNNYLEGKVKAVKFNLGYLPGGDHSITTEAEKTLQAVYQALNCLEDGGVITVVIYTGHSEGKKEKELIMRELGQLPQENYAVLSYRFVNQLHSPPELLALSLV